jgi:hypothetical protein
LVEHSRRILVRDGVAATVGFTGGTTFTDDRSAPPLLFFKSAGEIEVKRSLHEALRGRATPRPLILHLVNLGHGLDPDGSRDGCFQVPLERPYHLAVILSLLHGSFSFPGYTPRVEVLAGPLRLLNALTFMSMERGENGRELGVRLVSCSSNQLTSRTRGIFEGFWGAAVDETYGLSEVPGFFAHRCMDCGHFHFSPLALPEVLGLEDDEPVHEGVGRLVATALYPLCELQPIIRYDTGDAIALTGPCTASDAVGFEFLGRLPDLVTIRDAGRPRLIVAPTALHEALDGVPDIAIRPFSFTEPLCLATPVGQQKWSLQRRSQGSRLELRLEIELCWSPLQHPAAAERLGQELRERVLRRVATLGDAVESNVVGFDIGLHGPSTTRYRAWI